MALNDFQPTEIDGKVLFVNKDTKDIGTAIHEFSLTKEGKAYIQNPATGGGAAGSGGTSAGGGNVVTREQLEAMHPQQRIDFFNKGGQMAS
jgi:hypothetical protein